ncbi:SHOCT domain-containing protein [Enterococcus villorum]|uniref:SHOCT domain-containing protein n=2 Tax=Enterococcus villorum TaxID=112904 RepID=A0A511J082_9ENTE|nr:SHOCT domain-containing protein [Enterococcus villorum]EOH87590.1 hypothetical protein UAO_02301 [Enterococcus villorum ATCC 700913]EOW77691.1 hypothetical protein I591_00545 [Enterococcus villorum ATCC 700913]GEL91404.1 hypothetical protein EVI01_07410 [Enterococcus villorum]
MDYCEICGDDFEKGKKINLTSGEVICIDCKTRTKKEMRLGIFDSFKYSLGEIYEMYHKKDIDLKSVFSKKKSFLLDVKNTETVFEKGIHIIGGQHLIEAEGYTKIGQLTDGRVYFKGNYNYFYYLVSLDFEGARYRTETVQTSNGITNTNSIERTKKKGKSGKVVAGAIIGTMIVPGIGTAVGAYAGGKGKDKKKKKAKQVVSTKNVTSGTTREVEENSVCHLELVRLSDDKKIKISVKANSTDYHELASMELKTDYLSNQAITREQAIEKLKELKELFDLSIISEEEFDIKKKEYLSNI